MNDMRAVIVPKSDQINADDLLGGPITITIREVTIRPGTEQPVSIHFDGDNGKPYKPCKSMARVMVHCWGPDANAYKGRSMTLYCDPKVMWGGMAVGGIRISHMTDIDSTHTMALTATKGSRKPFTVQPLVADKPKAVPKRTITDAINELDAEFAAAATREAVDEVLASDKCQKALDFAKNGTKEKLDALIRAAMERTAPIDDGSAATDDSGFPGDRPSQAA